MSYCSHCGSANVRVTDSGNGGELYVAEDLGSGSECYDFRIEMLECNDCGKITYRSIGEDK